jgi:hypothetical protein
MVGTADLNPNHGVPMNTNTTHLALAALTAFATLAGCGERSATPEPTASTQLPSSSEPSLPLVLDEPEIEEPAPSVAEVAGPVVEDGESLSPPAPELYSEGGLTLRRFALTRDVENREPIDPAFAFPNEEAPLFAFVDVANATDEERSVRVIFESPTGEQMGMVDLGVPGEAPRWRTWAYSRMITEPGQWEAIVETDEGELLGRISFEIEAS